MTNCTFSLSGIASYCTINPLLAQGGVEIEKKGHCNKKDRGTPHKSNNINCQKKYHINCNKNVTTKTHSFP